MVGERSLLGFLDGGGRMGALMRSHDWSASPLGDPASWPDTLKAAVSTCLSSHFPMVIWWGPQLLMLYNDAWQPILGETKHPAGLGRPGAESWPETWPIVGVQFEGALKGVPSWSEDLLLASDRHGFIEECYFTYSHGPLRDASGEVVGVCSVVSETTARVLNERRLRILRDLSDETSGGASQRRVDELSQALVARLCDGNPDAPFAALYLADPRGHARRVASAGVDAAWLPPRLDPAENDAWKIARVLRTRSRATIDHTPRMSPPLPGGTWPEASRQLVVLPLFEPSIRFTLCGLLVVGANSRLPLDPPYVDFLELVAAEFAKAVSALEVLERERLALEGERLARADAERASRAKDEFLAMLSHELRIPLQAILTWAQALQGQTFDADEVRRAAVVIERNADRQSRLVEDMLDVSRIISGKLVLASEPVDLTNVVSVAAETLRRTFAEKGIELRLGVEDACDVIGDQSRLEQVVRNLLSNAVKFTPSGGRVELHCLRRGDEIELSVHDDGCGIDPDFVPHVFDRFRQEDMRTTRSHTGLGLGLAIVRHIVEMHGGTVSAVSEGRDQGSTFTIRLPWSSDARAFLPSASRGLEPVELTGIRLLAVDDEIDGRESIEIMLRPFGADVRTSGSVREAMTIVSNWRPDAIISDLAMPDADGFDLARQLRAAGLGDIPLIALTAHALAQDHDRALAEGFVLSASKPIRQRDLSELVRDALRRSEVQPNLD
jgi:signal transduction histidine kinase/CheY-like chemotaxis protein